MHDMDVSRTSIFPYAPLLRSVLAVLLISILLVNPGAATAQDGDTPNSIDTTEAPVEVVEEPASNEAEAIDDAPIPVETEPEPVYVDPAPVEPTAVPTDVPAIQTDVPLVPTDVPLVPTAVPTESPTAVPTVEPTIAPTPTPTPEIISNTDMMQLNGPSRLSLQPGGSTTISLSYDVTTPRQSTTISAALVNADGTIAAGWQLSSPNAAIDFAGNTVWSDATAITPGTSFGSSLVVTAPADVDIGHTVSLQLWSEATVTTGTETGVTAHVMASLDVVASLASPTITCAIETADVFTCTVESDRSDVMSGELTVTPPEGWMLNVGSTVVTGGSQVNLGSLTANGGISGLQKFSMTFDSGCAQTGAAGTVTLSIAYEYTNRPAASAETSITLNAPAQEAISPIVTMQSVDFGSLTWNGESWGAAEATSTITVHRDGCGDLGVYDIQIEVVGAAPGVEPMITSVSSSSSGVVPVTTAANPNNGPVGLAQTTTDFSGSAEITLTLRLVPEDTALPGSSRMGIQVTAMSAP